MKTVRFFGFSAVFTQFTIFICEAMRIHVWYRIRIREKVHCIISHLNLFCSPRANTHKNGIRVMVYFCTARFRALVSFHLHLMRHNANRWHLQNGSNCIRFKYGHRMPYRINALPVTNIATSAHPYECI